MRLGRAIPLISLAALTFGSLLMTGGYAWYLRSDAYRSSCAAILTERLGHLPAEIGRVIPRSLAAREFQAVRVWLPERRDEAAFFERAVLTGTPTADDPAAYVLDLCRGHCEVSTRTWLRDDYRTLIDYSLRPGFAQDGPRRVTFSGIDLSFVHEHFQAALHDAAGVVSFEDPAHGRANLTCGDFNGYEPPQRVSLYAQFSPTPTGVRLDQVELVVPDLPIAVVGLADLTGLGLHSGSFSGRLQYRETDPGHELTLSGKVFDLPLAECTRSVADRPWRGVACELELESLTLRNGLPVRAIFHGVFTDAVLGDMLSPWGMAEAGGNLTLRVQTAELSPAGIDRLVVSARCEALSLERVAAALGWGRMTGTARVVVDDLTIRQNRLASLDARILVDSSNGEPRWIERTLLSEVLRRTIGISLPSFLPNRFEYAQLGVRLEVRDETLWVFGTHGPRERAILSVRLADEEFPVVFEPRDPFDLRPALDGLRAQFAAQIAERLAAHVPHVWQALQAAPSRE